ncbi:MAG: NADH-quinone oxidoreductase subunit J [Microscillaceae bacterium]|jgi:NADH-quinone oxidoreductase subunit J|nr:NADH-quinone oxidoreductase subunit J [Microscillaceae bacterium]
MVLLLFYFFCFLIVVSAFLMLLTRHILYAAFLLLLTFLGIAALYALVGADFLAVSQVVIYVGGVLVLLLFGIMLTHQPVGGQPSAAPQTESRNLWWGALTGIGFFALLAQVIYKADFTSKAWIVSAESQKRLLNNSSIPHLGANLMTHYLLPFEIIAILLLVALVGATLLASRKS